MAHILDIKRMRTLVRERYYYPIHMEMNVVSDLSYLRFHEHLRIYFMGTRKECPRILFSFMFLLFNWLTSQYSFAIETITLSQQLSHLQTLTSPTHFFELGFFNTSITGRKYIGIWYKNISPQKVVWVANRENPIASASSAAASLAIGNDGNLNLVDGNQNSVWSTNVSMLSNLSYATLSDKGNLVLKDGVSQISLWESFNFPCHTILPTMMIGLNATSGEKRFLTSWNSEDDPSPGKYVVGLALSTPPQAYTWNGSTPYWRSGQWDKAKFIGIADIGSANTAIYEVQENLEQKTAYFSFHSYNSSFASYIGLTPTGYLEIKYWDQSKGEWITNWKAPNSSCEVYGTCGPFGICQDSDSPICKCLKGFVPKSSGEWSRGNWTGGCVRRTELLCKNNDRKISYTEDEKEDWFFKMDRMKLPDHPKYREYPYAQECQDWCTSNCSCLAYTYVDGIGCLIWITDLVDIWKFSHSGKNLYLRLAHSELGEEMNRVKFTISITAASGIIILGIIMLVWCRWKAKKRRKIQGTGMGFDLVELNGTPMHALRAHVEEQRDISELRMLEFNSIFVATNEFSPTNKLGQGGYGPVYKGKLQDGQEIAVKRLSNSTGYGIEQFKNEIILISKLQHRNLVKLLGCCIEEEEKILIYEYMPNKSLDYFLFDSTKRMDLYWGKRFNIIQGIARGLLYLHRDSCLRVIHRDLKVSNILLDEYMNPKIADFGLARIFQETQDLAYTHRVVGTFGYMSPEYVTRGIFSEKSDVFSFGVVLLEIVKGEKNNSSCYDVQHLTILSYAWQLWLESRGLDLIDQALAGSFSPLEVMRCVHVGLLCVQDHPADRPTMSAVVSMLSNETERPQPKKPTFTFESSPNHDLELQENNICSINDVTISLLKGR